MKRPISKDTRDYDIYDYSVDQDTYIDYLESKNKRSICPSDEEIKDRAAIQQGSNRIETYVAFIEGAKWLKSQIKLESKKHKLLIYKEIDNTCCGLDNIDGTDGRCLMCGSKDNL